MRLKQGIPACTTEILGLAQGVPVMQQVKGMRAAYQYIGLKGNDGSLLRTEKVKIIARYRVVHGARDLTPSLLIHGSHVYTRRHTRLIDYLR